MEAAESFAQWNTILSDLVAAAHAPQKGQALGSASTWWLQRRLGKLLDEQEVPSSLRGKLWSVSIGNSLAIETGMFDELASAGKTGVQYEEKQKRAALMATDMPRTFPELGSMFSAESSPYSVGLTRLLQAYSRFRPEVGDLGYVQGLSYLAAMFLMHGDVDGMCQDVCPAFVSLANLIERTVLLPLFRMEPATTDHYFTFFTETFQSFLPELAAHFELLELHPSVYLIDWTYTLFCKLLPPEVSIFVWDRIILHPDGDVYILKTALGLLQLMGPGLLACPDLGDCIGILRDAGRTGPSGLVQQVGIDKIFQTINGVRLSHRQWSAFRKQLDQSTGVPNEPSSWKEKVFGASNLRDRVSAVPRADV